MCAYQVPNLRDVRLTGGFWRDRQTLNRNVTITAVRDRFRDTGRFDAFRCDWREGMPNKPHIFWDSDIAKWMEAAAYLLAEKPDDELQQTVEWVIDQIERNQQPDGYFNSYFIGVQPSARYTNRKWHELYCAGHLIEAAIAYDQATGRDRFLKMMEKYAQSIDRVFRVERSAAFAMPGHEEIELALVKLYRHTGKREYMTLAEWFVDQRGNNELDAPDDQENGRAIQSHMPCRFQRTAEGHAVRAGYLYSAMADVAYERNDEKLLAACKAIFQNIAYRRMYVTGGVGSSKSGEVFTTDYDLQNEIAYTETCAAIALVMFAGRMLRIDPDSLYADIAETALYNGILSGISLDGKAFFYSNPLEIDVSHHGRNPCSKDNEWLPAMRRVEVFNCSCCPPNIARFIPLMGELLYTYGEGRIYAHQYAGSEARFSTEGREASLRQETRYPEDGIVRLTAKGMKGMKLCLRVPAWCDSFHINAAYAMEKGYAVIDVADDEAEYAFEMDMPAHLVEANPAVHANSGRVAVRRGPVVYCAEGVDNEGGLQELMIDRNSSFECSPSNWHALPDLLADGWRRKAPEKADASWLYRALKSEMTRVKIRMIPYFAMANRDETDMQVWLLLRG